MDPTTKELILYVIVLILGTLIGWIGRDIFAGWEHHKRRRGETKS